MDEPESPPRLKPTLKHALGALAFAVAFGVLMWFEHVWVLSRGDYAGIGMRHTWYWSTMQGLAVAFFVGVLVWPITRRKG